MNDQTQLSSKERKKQKVKIYVDWIKQSEAVYLSEPNITVNESTELKKQLHEIDAEYHVVNNGLFARALDEALGDKPTIEGFTGVVFCFKDPVEPAKALYKIVSDEKATIKFGYYSGSKIDDEKVKELSMLPGIDELLGKVAYMFAYPVQGFVNVLQAPMRDLVQTLEALREKKSSDN